MVKSDSSLLIIILSHQVKKLKLNQKRGVDHQKLLSLNNKQRKLRRRSSQNPNQLVKLSDRSLLSRRLKRLAPLIRMWELSARCM